MFSAASPPCRALCRAVACGGGWWRAPTERPRAGTWSGLQALGFGVTRIVGTRLRASAALLSIPKYDPRWENHLGVVFAFQFDYTVYVLIIVIIQHYINTIYIYIYWSNHLFGGEMKKKKKKKQSSSQKKQNKCSSSSSSSFLFQRDDLTSIYIYIYIYI